MANFCGKCGSKIQLGSAFCSNCGASISEEFISQPETMVTFPDKRKKVENGLLFLGVLLQ